MRPKKRGHMERSQPQTRPPSNTPTLRLNPISIPPEHERGDANQRADDDPEGDEHHVGHVGGAVGHADPSHGLREPARRAHESQDVAAVDQRCREELAPASRRA